MDIWDWNILRAIAKINVVDDNSSMADLLFELERTENSISEQLRGLLNLDYIYSPGEGHVSLSGNASVIGELAEKIMEELVEAGEDTEVCMDLFDSVLGY